MGRLQLNIPQIQRSQRQIPLDEIVAVQGNNPLAQGISSVGSTVSKVLNERRKIKMMAQQTRTLGKMAGLDIPEDAPDNAIANPDAIVKLAVLNQTKQEKNVANAQKKAELQLKAIELGQDRQIYDSASGTTKILPGIKGISVKNDASGLPYLDVPADAGSGSKGVTVIPRPTAPKDPNAPTAQSKNMGQMAATVIPHVDEFAKTVHQAQQAGFIGPAGGRIYTDFLAGRVGSTGDPNADYLLGRLKSQSSLLASGMLRMHFGARGGQEMYQKFADMDNVGKLSEQEILGALDTFKEYARGYAEMGGVKLPEIQKPKATKRWNPATQDLEDIP